VDFAPPIYSKGKQRYYRRPDSRCKTLAEQVDGMTVHRMNMFFCQGESQEARQILSGEERQGPVSTPPVVRPAACVPWNPFCWIPRPKIPWPKDPNPNEDNYLDQCEVYMKNDKGKSG
jgi:hypothetical protein